MTKERYEEFLRSPLGRWLETQLPSTPEQPAAAGVRRLIALLSAEITARIATGLPSDDVWELLDLVTYRLYGFGAEEVQIAEAYLGGLVTEEAVAGALSIG